MTNPTTTRPTAEALNAAIEIWQAALAKRNAARVAAKAAYDYTLECEHSDEAHKAHLAAYDVWYHAQVALQKAHAEAQALYVAYNR